MKTGLFLLMFVSLSTAGFGIGHPHNLFAARRAFLSRQATVHQANTLPAVPRGTSWAKRYSYTFWPPFSQIPHVRE